MERNLIPFLIDVILDEAEKNFEENEEITDQILSALCGIFDKVLSNALELIESKAVCLLQIASCYSKHNQFLFQITGSNGSLYILFHRVNYCQCKFYQQKVIHSKSYPACKHFIAANLAYVWKKYRQIEINFDTYKNLLQNIALKNDVDQEKNSKL